ncbi:unnamed protein product, partial [Cuscuta epithymum]
MKDNQTGAHLLQASNKDHLYPFHAFQTTLIPGPTWHKRLGHCGDKVLQRLRQNNFISLSSNFSHNCVSCKLGKSHRLPFHDVFHSCTAPLEIIHSDVWQSPVISNLGFKYYVSFIDDFSRYTWVYPMRRKSEVYTHFCNFQTLVENLFDRKIKVFQSDGGGEFDNIIFNNHFLKSGILFRKSCPDTPAQNGVAERKHRHLLELTRTMLIEASIPPTFWVDALYTATYIVNRLPTPLLNNFTPFEKLFNKPPDFNFLRVFGCACFPNFIAKSSNKLSPRSTRCVFIGYAPGYKGYRCLEPISGRVYISRDVLFHETDFPFSTLVSRTTSPPVTITDLPLSWSPSSTRSPPAQYVFSLPSANTSGSLQSTPHHTSPLTPQAFLRSSSSSGDLIPDDLSPSSSSSSSSSIPNDLTPFDHAATKTSPPSSLSPSTDNTTTPSNNSPSSTLPSLSPPPVVNIHPMRTRAKDGIFKPKTIFNLSVFSPPDDPTCFSQAQKFPVWRAAMADEFNALIANKTWDLVPWDSTKNVVACKWVYKTKFNSDGSVERHKARLVAQGFKQQAGVDFTETFSPVVKPTTVRLVLSVVVARGWCIRQLDVKNAFLHGHLTEEVFMRQPPGFIHPSFPHHVCRLKKALYGLKQAPRAWFHRFSGFLLSQGFSQSKSDSSMFVFRTQTHVVYILLYVDDILITGSSVVLVRSIIQSLSTQFAMKDLGDIHFFLGLQTKRTSKGLFLSQHKYISDLLRRFHLHTVKPIRTPLPSRTTLSLTDGELLTDATEYRSMVGALQYLILTRPDITYAVHLVSQFMHAPRTTHLLAVKRIYRYLQGTMDYGLWLQSNRDISLIVAYSDADWAGCPDSSRSTTGYAIFLGPNLISWRSKKQPTVSKSSTEAEYRAIAYTVQDTLFIRSLMAEMGLHISSPVQLHCDNVSASYLAVNPIQHDRSKHIKIDYHFVRERVAHGDLVVKYVPTQLQLADIFTKNLSS